MSPTVIFVPGWHNGGIDILSSKHLMWFGWLASKLSEIGVPVFAPDYPDAYLCRSNIWLPFLKQLGDDKHTILIGHSTGAIASMRYAEQNQILGSVLVGSYYTDLGDAEEAASGYFDHPWEWERIKENQKWIVQFHSTDDPWIPSSEAALVHEQLQTEYHEFHDRGHFGVDRPYTEFPELFDVLRQKLDAFQS